jgi:hypothetical protein
MATRGRSYRRGDLAEGIGLELLRRFCAVAPVPRPEDVGLDAVATLLRPDGRDLVPERSFFVTLKSKGQFARSDRGLTYETKHWPWLRSLELPCFLGVVDLAGSSVEMYSFHRLTYRLHQEARRGWNWTSLRVHLGHRDGQPWSKNVLGEGTELSLWLGPPVLAFSITDAARKDFERWAYGIMSPFVAADANHMRYAELGIISLITWSTNESAHRRSGWGGIAFGDEVERDQLEAIRPVLQQLYNRAVDAERHQEAVAYRTLLDRCVELGLEEG